MDIAKPNCIGCPHIHPDNGNCTAVGGFCTAVPAAYCPLISEIQAENEKLRADVVRFNDLLASYQNVLVPELRAEADGMRSNWYKAVEEVKNLRAELEQVKNERDGARATLYELELYGQKED